MLDTPRPDRSVSEAHAARAFDPMAIDIGSVFRQALRGIWRQISLIGAIAAGLVLISLIYVLTSEPMFTASSRIIIDPRVGSGPETPTAPMLLLSDELVVDSEVEVLQSRELAGRVVDQLKLLDNPLMATEPGAITILMGGLRSVIDTLVMEGDEAVEDLTPEQIVAARREKMVDNVLGNLSVARSGSTYVIGVGYTSPDRFLSARIANTFVEQYFSLQAEATYENTRRLGEWLSERVALLGDRVLDADRNVETYRREENLINVADGRLPSEVEYEAGNAQLLEVRNEKGSLEANVRQLQNIIQSGAMNAPLDQNVRTQTLTELQARFAELVGRERDLSTRFGANHNLARRARDEIAATRQQIIEEFEKIAESQTSRVAILTGQENDLLTRLTNLRSETADDASKMIRLRELEREASSNRSLYENMLAKMNETAQTETFKSAPARIIARAIPPETKSEPQTKLILALGLFGGLVLGVGAAFLREQMDTVFRFASSMEDELGIPLLGITPTFAADRQRLRKLNLRAGSMLGNPGTAIPSKIRPFRFAADNPTTMFAETLRTIVFTMNVQRSGQAGKVVAITSSRKGEGKSVLSGNLATYASASGAKVALIDFDVRARAITNALPPAGEVVTLTRLIEDENAFFALAPNPDFGNVYVIPNNGKTLSHNAGSANFVAGFELLVARLRREFDLVVIDLPPAAALVDSRIAARLVDHMIFAVEWGRTNRSIARNIVEGNFMLKSKLLGGVFTKVRLPSFYRYNADTPAEYYDYVR